MKIGITQIVTGNMSLDDLLSLCRKAGYQAVELSFREGAELDINMSESEIKAVAKKCADAGVEIASVIGGYRDGGSMLSLNPEDRKKSAKSIRRMLEIGSILGTDGMLLHPGQLRPEGTYTDVWNNFLQELKELAPVAESYKVAICVENVWNKFLLSPKEMREFIDAVGSNWVGVYLDTANMMAYGYTEHWIRELGKRIRKVHFKDFKRSSHQFVNLLDGDTDWKLVITEFRNIGYDSYVVHEVDGDFFDIADRMRKIISM